MDFFYILLLFIIFFWLISVQNKISAMEAAIKTLTKKITISPEQFKVKNQENFENKPAENVEAQPPEQTNDIPYENSFSQYVVSPEKEKALPPQTSEENLSEAEEKAIYDEEYNELSSVPPPLQYEKNNEKIQNNTENVSKTPSITADFDIQKMFLENVNKIGALAIIVALIIFIGLVSPYIVLTPLMKTVLGYIACFAFIGCGFYLHTKENMQKYSEVLLGTGFAGLFITTFCAYGLFKLISASGVIGAGIALLIATYCVADKMKTLSMLIIGLIGAYLTPLFAGASMGANLYYILFVNIISLVYTLRNKSVNWINIINITIAMSVFMGYFCFYNKAFLSQYAYLKIVFPIVLWGANILYDILRDKNNKLDDVYSMINYGVLTLFSVVLFSEAKLHLAILLAATAAGYFGLAVWGRNKAFQNYKFYDYSVLINIWLIVLFGADIYWRTIVWGALGLGIAYSIKKYEMKHFIGGLLAYFSSSLYAVFASNIDSSIGFLGKYIPLINERTLLFGIPVLSMITSASLIKNVDKRIQNILLFSATTLVYLFITAEITSVFLVYYDSTKLLEYNRAISYIIVGLLYALNTVKFGQIYNSQLFKVAGQIVYGASIFTLLCCSFIDVPDVLPIINFRFLAYIVGVAVSILMSEWSKNKDYSNALIFMGTTLGYLGLTAEAGSIFALFKESPIINFNEIITYIIIAFMYALNCSKFAKAFQYEVFKVAGQIVYGASIFALICCSYTYPDGMLPILNTRFLAYILGLFISYKIAKDEEKEIYKYSLVGLGFMLCHTESVGIVEISSAFQFLISLSWILYSGAITILGIIKNKKYLINSGIFLIVLTILRIFIYDLAKVEAIYKLVAFLALGVILMLVSYVYTKNKNKE